jgi:hypothetical protein
VVGDGGLDGDIALGLGEQAFVYRVGEFEIFGAAVGVGSGEDAGG